MSNGARLTSASTTRKKMNAPTGWITTNHMSVCALVISTRLIEFASRMAITKQSPSESSYEIICAEERRPPGMAYLLLLDHPASTMPYTAIEAIDMIYSTPTFRSATYRLIVRPNNVNGGPNGMTAAMIREGTTVRIGARM